MTTVDYVWLGFLIVGVLAGLWIIVDECIDAHKRGYKTEDWEP